MVKESGASSKKRNGASSETTTLSTKLSHDELLKQLKALAKELQGAEQSSNASQYNTQAAFLASPFIIKHKDKDIKLHAALCLVDILRVYAPEAPYDKDQMWDIFSLIISQLKGLEHGPNESKYNKTFYILESLALVRTFNICAELDFQDLILQLFNLLFSIVNEKHTIREQTFMVEIMSPIFQESESISQELLDSVLINIIEPQKTRNPAAYKVACNLIERTSTNIEPFIQMFFNSVLTLGKTSESDLCEKVYELILELNRICSSVLLSVLPQLEFKLKSSEVEERLTVTKLLAQMFSDPDSELAMQNKPLWNCFLERFHDINVDLRIECVRSAKPFLLQHPELARDVTDKLCSRSKDPDERVRQEVVAVAFSAAAENIKSFSNTTFEELCERMRDKKLSVRVEALMSLGKLYKGYVTGPNADPQVAKNLYWLPSKLLNGYYQNMVEDRLCVERVLSGCLVPVTLKTKDRMKLLFSLYNKLDEHAVEAFKVLLKCQANVRADLAALVRLSQNEKSEENYAQMLSHVITLARALPDPFKSQENLKKLQNMLQEARTRELFKIAVDIDAGCPAVFKAVTDIVVQLGARNPILETVKALLDRAAPIMVDSACVQALFEMVKKLREGLGDDDDDDDEDGYVYRSTEKEVKGMELLLMLSEISPSHFRTKQCYETILVFLKHNDQQIVNLALHILSNVAEGMETEDKDTASYYQPVLTQLACKGTPQQAKFAMKSIAKIFKDPSSVFDRIFTSVLENLEYDHPLVLSHLTTLAQMAVLAPSIFETRQKTIIKDFVVKELLVKDRSTVEDSDSQGDNDWCDDCDVTRETQAKVKGIKLMIRWLQGLRNNHHNSVLPVLRLLSTLLANGGDLQNNGCVCSHDCSRLRLAASCGILKIAQELHYEEAISLENFQQLALTMQDVCAEVKATFTKKLHKALDSLKLPLEYLAIFALAASDADKDKKTKVRQMISRNVAIRKEYLKQHSAAQACSHSLLPEYALPALIHLLAHHPDFNPKEHDSLVQFREYIWFFMEPILSSKTENSGLLKKLIETTKQTKDAQNPEDQDANEAMYTLCDLTYGLIVSKASGLVMEEFPGQPLLPKKMFLPGQMDTPNTKSYLPPGFAFLPGKKNVKVSKITTNQKSQKPAKSTAQKQSGNNAKANGTSNKAENTQKNGLTKRTKEIQDSDEESGPSTPPPVRRRVLNDEKPQKTTRTKSTVKQPAKETPKQVSRQTKKTTKDPTPQAEPAKAKSTKKDTVKSKALKEETPKSTARSRAEKPSPKNQTLSNKRTPFKRDAQPTKSGSVPKRLRTELDVSPDDDPLDSQAPLPARKGRQKGMAKEQESPKKQTSKKRGRTVRSETPPVSPKKRKTSSVSPTKSPKTTPVKSKAKAKSTRSTPVKKESTSGSKSPRGSPVKRQTTAKSPKSTPVKRKAVSSSESPRRSTRGTPVKAASSASPAKSPKRTDVKQKTASKSSKGNPVKNKAAVKSPKGTPVKKKGAAQSPRGTPVKKKAAVKSPKGTPVKQKTTTKSPVKRKATANTASPKKSPRSSPVKRNTAPTNKQNKAASSPSKRTRTAQPSPAKRQKTESPSKAKQTTLNVKRRPLRKR